MFNIFWQRIILVKRGGGFLVSLHPMQAMKSFTSFTTTFCSVALGVFLAGTTSVFAEAKLDVSKPDFDDLQSPALGAKKSWNPKDWLEMEVKFKVSAVSPKPKDGFVDRITVRWYVAVENPGGKGYWLLEKEVTHVNIPVGEDLYASVYLSPNSVKRLSGGERASKAILYAVGGEINVAGTTEYFSSKGKAGWWTSGNLSRTDKVPLLNKDETPFRLSWYDRYAEIEKKR